ncbi:MAG: VCBS repeat-containing protein [Rhodoferax sp.]|nr:VCBS repeat-containing protein [Rhodoferax sp.]
MTSFKQLFHRGVLLTALAVTACGGGGGSSGDVVIPPFWSRGGVVVADFDGDKRSDVAVAATYIDGPPPHSGYVEIYRQSGAGVFAAPVRYSVGPDPWGMSVGDINGDGHLDLVIATPHALPIQVNTISDSGGISLLRQDAAHPGSFLTSQWLVTGGLADDAAIAYLDGDGLADLIVADAVSVNARALMLQQNPAAPGTFLAPVSLPTGSGGGSDDVTVADINGDGRTDMVLAAENSIVVFYQKATGGFEPAAVFGAGISTQGVAVADLNGDGRADLVAVNAGYAPSGGSGGASVSILLQSSPGSFVATQISVADGARRVAIGDLNQDGIPDMSVVSMVYQNLHSPSRVSVLLQSAVSRGQFTVAGVYTGPDPGSFIAIGDMNGDGRNDLVVETGPSVLLQSASAPGTFEAVKPLR